MLHDKEQSILCLDDFVELNNVRVLNYFQNVNLARNSLDVIDVVDLPLVEDFDGDTLARVHVDALLHLAKRALAECLLYLIVTNPATVHMHSLIAHRLLCVKVVRLFVRDSPI